MANLSNINNKFLVTDGGKVGIGITAPTGILHTDQTFSGYAPVTFKNSVTNQGQFVELITSTDEGSKYTGIESISLQTGNGWKVWGGGNNFGEMYLSVSGSHAIVIKSNLNVGIGTNSPAQPLSVHGSFLVRTTNADGNKNRMQCIVGGSSDAANLYLYYGNSGDGTVSVRINAQGDSYFNGGNVGIGTTSPSSYYADQLVVKCSSSENGITIVSNSTLDANYLMFADGTSGDDRFRGQISYNHQDNFMAFAVNASNKMRIKSGGEVGIGRDTLLNNALTVTKSDANSNFYETLAAIEICNSNADVGKWRSLNFKVGAGNYTETLAGIYCQYATFTGNVTGTMVFATRAANSTNPTERMRLDSSGNAIFAKNISVTDGTLTLNKSDGSLVKFVYNGTTRGYIGSSRQLFTGGLEADMGYLATGDSVFGAGGAQRMIISSSGNVGIGISTPYSKLQVNGAVDTLCAHFGGQYNTNGHYQGISLGYAEAANAAYRKVAIVAQATGDGAARQNLLFLVDGASDSNSASIADNKMILNYDGAIKIGNGSNIAINTNGGHYHAAGPSGLSMRQYQYYVDIPNGSTIDLFKNSSAYSDLQMTKISIVMYHSSRTYFVGMGTVGGYGFTLTGAGIGQANGGLTSAVISTGIRKLQIANNAGFAATARIFIEIMADSGVIVLNGSISAPY